MFKGDLVEILNLSDKQLNSIRSQRCRFEIMPCDIIGNRYFINNIITNHSGEPLAELLGWNHGGHFNGWFEFSQLRKIE